MSLKKGDEKWQEFVLSNFKEDELVEDNPTCNGLRRVCEKVYGRIISCMTEILKVPTESDRSATVVCTIKCQEYNDLYILTQSASADVYEENTVHPYSLHPVATAETRAEGRALRKLLGLDCATHEELTSDNPQGKTERMLETQVRSMNNLASQVDVDFTKFLAKYGYKKEDMGPGSKIKKQIAEQMLQELSTYKTKSQEVPPELRPNGAGHQGSE